SRRRHTRLVSDWSSDVCSSDLTTHDRIALRLLPGRPRGLRPERRALSALPEPDPVMRRGRPLELLLPPLPALSAMSKARISLSRSEERRVGKEGRYRWWEER